MSLSPEQWARLEDELRDRGSSLMGAKERFKFFKEHSTEEEFLKNWGARTYEGGLKKRRTINITEDENYRGWSGGIRALEDLVLECVDAGVNLDDYL